MRISDDGSPQGVEYLLNVIATNARAAASMVKREGEITPGTEINIDTVYEAIEKLDEELDFDDEEEFDDD